MRDWGDFPLFNNSSYYQQEQAKIESAKTRIFYDKNVAFYKNKQEDSLEINITGLSFKGNGSDIGMATISSVFVSITQGIDEPRKAGHLNIKGVGFTKWIFTLESLAITFTYNQGTKEWYRGVVAVIFELLTIVVTIIVTASLTWWLAIIVAALIAFLAAIFSNTQMGKNAINTLAEIIKTNAEKAKRFFDQKIEEFFNLSYGDTGFWKNICEDIACKDFSEESLYDLLSYCEYCKADGLSVRGYFSNLFDGHYDMEKLCDSTGRFSESYKTTIQEAFTHSMKRKKDTLAHNTSKPKNS